MKAEMLLRQLSEEPFIQAIGYVRSVAAGSIEASGPNAAPGTLCAIAGEDDQILAEVVRTSVDTISLMPLQPVRGIAAGARVTIRSRADQTPVGDQFAGRVVDGLGAAIDGKGVIRGATSARAGGDVPKPLDRAPGDVRLATGLRVVDGLLPLSVGQRVGIFAASGVGKTSLVEQLAGQIDADHCVLCLVGERGREVEAMTRFIAGQADPKRFTIVAATSDESAALRVRAADTAAALAEHWRARGRHVLLIIDSVTRYAMALREIGLAAGAPPTVRAYTPNVFAALPRLVERCGAVTGGGAITAIMTVLSETDDVDDPIVEVMKSLLDGHIILSRTLAEQGHFPAVDVPKSVSRGSDLLVTAEHAALARQGIALLSAYEDSRIMVESGLYKMGSSAVLDRAIRAREPLTEFLRQRRDETSKLTDTLRQLSAIVGRPSAHG